MPQFRPRIEAISYEEKQELKEMPMLEALPQGGVLARHAETRPGHTGELPDLRGIECLPLTEPPVEQLTLAQEAAMEAVLEGCVGSLPDQLNGTIPFAPPTDTVYSWETPVQVYCALPRSEGSAT